MSSNTLYGCKAGSPRRRKDGAWEVPFYKRVRRRFPAAFSRAEVERAAKELTITEEVGAPASTPTLTEVIEKFISMQTLHNTTPTVKYYCSYLAPLVVAFGDRQVGTVTTAELEHLFYQRIRGQTVTKATVNKMIGAARTLWRYAIEQELAYTNPVDKIKRLKGHIPQHHRALTLGEVQAILQHVSPNMRALITFVVLTGLRRRSLVNLQWSDIDITNRRITVRVTKNHRPHVIPINDELLVVIEAIPRVGDSEWVFPQTNGKKRSDTTTYLNRVIRRACDLADISPPATFHGLRSTCATLQLHNGADVRSVQEQLGHSDINVTAGYLTPRTPREVGLAKTPQETSATLCHSSPPIAARKAAESALGDLTADEKCSTINRLH